MSGRAAGHDALTVLKLGGSYAFSPHLPAILEAVSAARVPLAIVPGGGPFADAVREAQPRMRFGEGAAHRMALLAMAQYAEALAGLGPRLVPARDIAGMRTAFGRGHVALWSPWPMTDGLEALPESWALTSDSLSAWLAGRLGAARLILLKHRDAPENAMSLAEAARAGMVDPLFPDYTARSGADVCWIGPAQLAALPAILDGRSGGLRLAAEAREPAPA